MMFEMNTFFFFFFVLVMCLREQCLIIVNEEMMHLKKPTSNLNNYVLQVSGIDGARTYTAGVAHILI